MNAKRFSVVLGAAFLSFQVAVGMAAVDGKKIVETACTKCHGLDKIKAAKKDRAGWEETVARMMQKGASVKAEEKGAVIDYLSAGAK